MAIPDFAGKRWLKIGLRSLHLVGFGGVFATALVSEYSATLFWQITLVSGSLLLILEAGSNSIWWIQLRGLAVQIKLILLVVALYFPQWQLPLFVTIILLSGVFSHAPGNIRYYSWFHRKVIKSIHDIKG